VLGFNLSEVNFLRGARGGVEFSGVDLSQTEYKMMSDVRELFAFNFQDPEQLKLTTEINFDFKTTSDGSFNAIAVWFDLKLDDEITLSSAPGRYQFTSLWNFIHFYRIV
jgi:hypothetical protein